MFGYPSTAVALLKRSISLGWLPPTSGDITLFIPRCQSETRQEIGVSHGRQFCCHSNLLAALFVRDGPVTCSHKNESAEGAATRFGFKTWLWISSCSQADGGKMDAGSLFFWPAYEEIIKKRNGFQRSISFVFILLFHLCHRFDSWERFVWRGDLSGWFW